MVETVEDLAERFPRRAKFAEVRRRLAAREGEEPRATELPLASWPLDALTVDDLPKALKRTYARGREAFAVADRDPTAEHLHEWRKRVKDLWYQERLLEETWPGVLKAQAKEAKKLSKILGEDHDLAVLSALLQDDAKLAALSGEIQGLIAERRAELLSRARALGRRVYAERPKHFARRLGRYVALA
jgi:CHAD domain-containing protein